MTASLTAPDILPLKDHRLPENGHLGLSRRHKICHCLQGGAIATTNMTGRGGKSSLSAQEIRRVHTKCLQLLTGHQDSNKSGHKIGANRGNWPLLIWVWGWVWCGMEGDTGRCGVVCNRGAHGHDVTFWIKQHDPDLMLDSISWTCCGSRMSVGCGKNDRFWPFFGTKSVIPRTPDVNSQRFFRNCGITTSNLHCSILCLGFETLVSSKSRFSVLFGGAQSVVACLGTAGLQYMFSISQLFGVGPLKEATSLKVSEIEGAPVHRGLRPPAVTPRMAKRGYGTWCWWSSVKTCPHMQSHKRKKLIGGLGFRYVIICHVFGAKNLASFIIITD